MLLSSMPNNEEENDRTQQFDNKVKSLDVSRPYFIAKQFTFKLD